MNLRDYMTPDEIQKVDIFFAGNGWTEWMKRISTKYFRNNLWAVLQEVHFWNKWWVLTYNWKERAVVIPFKIYDIIQRAKEKAAII